MSTTNPSKTFCLKAGCLLAALIWLLPFNSTAQQPRRLDQSAIEAEHLPAKVERHRADKIVSDLTGEVATHLPGIGSTVRDATIRNLIDQYIFSAMKRDGIPHAPRANDQEFCRRIYLDLTGRIPTPAQLLAFLNDQTPHKRDRLIDELLASEAWVARWGYWFGDQYRAALNRIGQPALGHFDNWIRRSLRADKPYDQFVTELLTASAPNSNWMPDAAPSSYLARWHVQGADATSNMFEDTADEIVVNIGRNFLGINYQCVSCHGGKGHLEKVNLDLTGKRRRDFWAMAAFFGRTRVRIVPYQDRYTVTEDGAGYDTKAASAVRLQREGGEIVPTFILTGEQADPAKPLRPQLARMLTRHPQFARATVNYFWKEFFALGIVDPVDSFDLARLDPRTPPPAPWTVQPTNAALLDALAHDFAAHGYSLKRLMRMLAQSSVYQLSSRFDGEWKESYTPYFARKFVRVLSAEEIHDAISEATQVYGNYKKRDLINDAPLPSVRYFTEFAATNELGNGQIRFFLNTFGQSNRDQFDRQYGGSVLQAMLLMNSDFINSRVKAANGSRVEQLLKAGGTESEIVEQLFLATLARRPTEHERAASLRLLAANRVQGAEDLQWSLLNKLDFIFNY